MSAAKKLTLSPDEFLEWENRQEEKHEYHRGEVFAMAGGTASHATIISNVVFGLMLALRGRGCRVFTEAMRVRIDAADVFTYPDLSVVCGEPRYHDTRKTALLNPLVLVEVLSPSTESYDRTTKFGIYAQIPELQGYVIVSQDSPAVDAYTRDGDGWRLTRADEGIISVPPLDCHLALDDLYDGVTFPDRSEFVRPTPDPGG